MLTIRLPLAEVCRVQRVASWNPGRNESPISLQADSQVLDVKGQPTVFPANHLSPVFAMLISSFPS